MIADGAAEFGGNFVLRECAAYIHIISRVWANGEMMVVFDYTSQYLLDPKRNLLLPSSPSFLLSSLLEVDREKLRNKKYYLIMWSYVIGVCLIRCLNLSRIKGENYRKKSFSSNPHPIRTGLLLHEKKKEKEKKDLTVSLYSVYTRKSHKCYQIRSSQKKILNPSLTRGKAISWSLSFPDFSLPFPLYKYPSLGSLSIIT